MRILKLDKKNKFISVLPEILDDLWHLSKIIEAGDIIKSSATRKIKAEEGREARREKIFIELQAEKIEFHEFSGLLRVSGIIIGGKPEELIELKAHQSIEISLGQKVSLTKKEWKNFQIEHLKKAEQDTKKKPFILVVLDNERADIAFLKEFKLQLKTTIKSKKAGKQFKEEQWKADYFNEILKKLNELKPEKTIIAGPGFIKEELKDFLQEKNFKSTIFLESTGSTGITGLNELLKGKGIQKIIQELEIVKNQDLIEKIFKEIGKETGLAEYGLNETEKALNYGAVNILLVSDSFLLANREKSEELMLLTEKMNGKIHIISSETQSGEKLDSLGGIAALLRFRVKA